VGRSTNGVASKKAYELGQTAAQALLVKHYFQNTESLGLSALVKDNFFFGNNSAERVGSYAVNYNLKARLTAFYEEGLAVDQLLSVFNKIADRIQLSQLDSIEFSKCLDHNLINFDDVLGSHKQTVYSQKRGKVVASGLRSAGKPRTSPVFLKEEMGLLTSLVTPYWEPLDQLKNNWTSTVLNSGFKSCHDLIAKVMTRRWQTLSRFAKLTTIRLQEIRATDPGSLKGTRKANITFDNVSATLRARTNPVEKFFRELLVVIPESELKTAVTKGLRKGKPKSPKDARLTLQTEIASMYLNMTSNPLKIEMPQHLIEVEDFDEQTIVKALNALTKVISLIGSITGQSNSTKRYTHLRQLPGRLGSVEAQTRSLARHLEDLTTVPKAVIKSAIDLDMMPINSPAALEIKAEQGASFVDEFLIKVQEIENINKEELSRNVTLSTLVSSRKQKLLEAKALLKASLKKLHG